MLNGLNKNPIYTTTSNTNANGTGGNITPSANNNLYGKTLNNGGGTIDF